MSVGVGVVMVGVAGGIGVGFIGGLIGVVVLRLYKDVRWDCFLVILIWIHT